MKTQMLPYAFDTNQKIKLLHNGICIAPWQSPLVEHEAKLHELPLHCTSIIIATPISNRLNIHAKICKFAWIELNELHLEPEWWMFRAGMNTWNQQLIDRNIIQFQLVCSIGTHSFQIKCNFTNWKISLILKKENEALQIRILGRKEHIDDKRNNICVKWNIQKRYLYVKIVYQLCVLVDWYIDRYVSKICGRKNKVCEKVL